MLESRSVTLLTYLDTSQETAVAALSKSLEEAEIAGSLRLEELRAELTEALTLESKRREKETHMLVEQMSKAKARYEAELKRSRLAAAAELKRSRDEAARQKEKAEEEKVSDISDRLPESSTADTHTTHPNTDALTQSLPLHSPYTPLTLPPLLPDHLCR